MTPTKPFTPLPPFTLTDDETHSPLWARLKAHLVSELEIARGKNDRPHSETETAAFRGEIRCLKNLINLGLPGQTTGDEDSP